MEKRPLLPWLLIFGGGTLVAYLFSSSKDESEPKAPSEDGAKGVVARWVATAKEGWRTASDVEAALLRSENYGMPLSIQFFATPVSPEIKAGAGKVPLQGDLVNYGTDSNGRFFDVAVSNGVETVVDGVTYQGPKKGTVYRLRMGNVSETSMLNAAPIARGSASIAFSGDKAPVNLADPITPYSDPSPKKYDASKWTTFIPQTTKPITVAEYKAASMGLGKMESMFIKTAVRLKENAAIKGLVAAEVLRTYFDAPEPYVLAYVVGESMPTDSGASVYHELIYVPLSHVSYVSKNPGISLV